MSEKIIFNVVCGPSSQTITVNSPIDTPSNVVVSGDTVTYDLINPDTDDTDYPRVVFPAPTITNSACPIESYQLGSDTSSPPTAVDDNIDPVVTYSSPNAIVKVIDAHRYFVGNTKFFLQFIAKGGATAWSSEITLTTQCVPTSTTITVNDALTSTSSIDYEILESESDQPRANLPQAASSNPGCPVDTWTLKRLNMAGTASEAGTPTDLDSSVTQGEVETVMRDIVKVDATANSLQKATGSYTFFLHYTALGGAVAESAKTTLKVICGPLSTVIVLPTLSDYKFEILETNNYVTYKFLAETLSTDSGSSCPVNSRTATSNGDDLAVPEFKTAID